MSLMTTPTIVWISFLFRLKVVPHISLYRQDIRQSHKAFKVVQLRAGTLGLNLIASDAGFTLMGFTIGAPIALAIRLENSWSTAAKTDTVRTSQR